MNRFSRHRRTSTCISLRGGTIFVLFGILTLAGCAEQGYDDLRSYVTQVKSRKGGAIQPLPEFKTYETFSYSAEERRDPFKAAKEEAVVSEASADSDGVHPNSARHREALEGFPLDSLAFVGIIRQDGKTWGVVTGPDRLVYRVSVGNYIGQNYGRIHTISETEVGLTEIVPNGRGGWLEREAVLKLSE